MSKPFDRDRFAKTLARARAEHERRSEGDLSERLRSVLAEWKSRKEHVEGLVVRSGGRVLFLRVEELHPLFRGDFTVVLRGGKQLTLSKGYRDRLRV